MRKTFLTIIAVLSWLNAFSAEPGDAAPQLNVEVWLKNGPLIIPEHGTMLVAFLTSWENISVESIAILSKLQNEYAQKGLQTAAITSRGDANIAESLAALEDTNFAVALDDGKKTESAYSGNPPGNSSFYIIRDGKILWKGTHAGAEYVLRKVFDGTFNASEAGKIEKLHKDLEAATERNNNTALAEIADRLLELDAKDESAIQTRLYIFQQQRKPMEAIAFLNAIIARTPETPLPYFLKIDILQGRTDIKESDLREAISQAIEAFKKDPVTLSSIAKRQIIDAEPGDAQIELGIHAAELALASAEKDSQLKAEILETLARGYYATGLLDKAFTLQKESMTIASSINPQDKHPQKMLDYYKKMIELNKKLKSQLK